MPTDWGRSLRSNRRRYQIYRNQNGLCAECGEPLDSKFEIDHRQSWKNKGPTEYWNLAAVHPRCNRRKGAK